MHRFEEFYRYQWKMFGRLRRAIARNKSRSKAAEKWKYTIMVKWFDVMERRFLPLYAAQRPNLPPIESGIHGTSPYRRQAQSPPFRTPGHRRVADNLDLHG